MIIPNLLIKFIIERTVFLDPHRLMRAGSVYSFYVKTINMIIKGQPP